MGSLSSSDKVSECVCVRVPFIYLFSIWKWHDIARVKDLNYDYEF